MKKIVLIFSALFIQALGLATNPSDSTDIRQSLLEKMMQDEPLEVTITMDIQQLLENRRKPDYQEAQMQYKKNGKLYHWSIELRPRGKFRRTMCEFPPLKLEFSKRELEKAGLQKQDDLKLVTHCLGDSSLTAQLLFREYLAYKLYNEISIQSLRVQLVKINYIDQKDPTYTFERWGILLEDIDELADRLGGEEIEQFSFKPGQLDTIQHTFVALFQMMIGNSDWGIDPVRNLKLIQEDPQKPFVLVPYDFDFSAWVGAPYASPRPDLGQTSVQDPIFQGITSSYAVLQPVMKLFKVQRKSLFKVVQDFEWLSRQEKAPLFRQLRQFYRSLETPDELLMHRALGL